MAFLVFMYILIQLGFTIALFVKLLVDMDDRFEPPTKTKIRNSVMLMVFWPYIYKIMKDKYDKLKD